jgi:hypothetical protein
LPPPPHTPERNPKCSRVGENKGRIKKGSAVGYKSEKGDVYYEQLTHLAYL